MAENTELIEMVGIGEAASLLAIDRQTLREMAQRASTDLPGAPRGWVPSAVRTSPNWSWPFVVVAEVAAVLESLCPSWPPRGPHMAPIRPP